jgi:signal transduction histidine kinase
MTERMARRLAHGLWISTSLLFAAAVVLGFIEDLSGTLPMVLAGLPIAMYATVGALVARRRLDSPIGWLFCGIAMSLAIWVFGLSYAGFGGVAGVGFGTLPGAATAAWIGILAPVLVLPVALPAFLLVFPDGNLRSGRWRLAMWAAVLGGVFVCLGVASTIDRYSGALPMTTPGWLGRVPFTDGFLAIGVLLAAGAALAGLFSLAFRFREAEGERRHQLRLLLWILVAMAVPPLLVIPLQWFGLILVFLVDGGGILFGIPAATAIAVLTFGLYDVGVVLKKTIVYGLIVVFLTIFAVLVVFFLSPIGLLGTDAGPGSTSGLVAARIVSGLTFVALTVAATWRLTRRMARRIVYGKRATPYEAMAEFSERLGETYSTDDVLPRMAEIVRASTGAAVARVWLHVGGVLRPAASSPLDAPADGPVALTGNELPQLPGVRAIPVRHRGELLGALTLDMPAAEPLSKTGQKLVTDLASQAGLVLRNVGLIEELRQSRRRIVAAQDERARKLERDIHDGAQQQLVGLAIKQGLVQNLIARDPDKARHMLSELQADTTDALDNLRNLARGIYPPLLADQGLAAALEAQARKSPVAVSLDAVELGRFPQEVEATVYFCVLEALQNIAKYAQASSASILLALSNGSLRFVVEDDGKGFDTALARGTGLMNMRDRLEAIGGALELDSAPGRGTTVRGQIPVTVSTPGGGDPR